MMERVSRKGTACLAAYPRWSLAFVLIALVLSGCSSSGPAPVVSRERHGPAPAGFYRIQSGDTLYSIAFRRGLDYRALAQWNGLATPYRIYSGRLLRVEPKSGAPTADGGRIAKPTRKKAPEKEPVKVAKAKPGPKRSTAGSKSAASSSLKWQWPLRGEIVQTFRRGDRTRQGIRIAGRSGQGVLAAEGGTVVYSGSGLKGYGNLIIVKHNEAYLSAYGFNRRLLVTEGQRVKRGQRVAEVGQASGGAYLLHFEIRKDGAAKDPLRYLPGS
jgi:lipoprotein NlpD